MSRVIHEGTLYLVDKDSGIVYKNDMANPQEVGQWFLLKSPVSKRIPKRHHEPAYH